MQQRMIAGRWKPAVAGIGLLAFLSCPVAAQDAKGSMIFVFDASGSMWGAAGNEVKIAAAKKVMHEVLKDMAADVELALVAYGHRRKGDCADIETLAAPGTPSGRIAETVSRIVPQGMTPITEALRRAAGLVARPDRPATIVLVSDGIETCKGDPCALAKELAGKGLKLVIHTVGFGVNDPAARQLQCIAKAAGGNYYHATDRASLARALSAVRQAVVEQKPAPPPPPPPAAPTMTAPPKSTTTRIQIAGPGTILLKPAAWVKLPVYRWQAMAAETGEEKGQSRKELSMRIPPGEYRLVWRQTEHNHTDLALTSIVNVNAGQTVEVPIDTGLRLTLPQGFGVPYRWSLRPEGGTKPIVTISRNLDAQVLPAGSYELDWHEDEHRSTRMTVGRLEIAPGKLNEHLLNHGLRVTTADWVPANPYRVVLAGADGKPLGYWRTLGAHIAPPGKYRLLYWQNEHRQNAVDWGDITVPENGFVDVAINSGIKFIPQAGVAPPYRAYFVDLDSKKEYRWSSGGKTWEPVALPPGRYRLDWHEKEHSTRRMTLVEEFKIEPGTLVELQM